MKLELKHLAGYLPYRLRILTNSVIREMVCDLKNEQQLFHYTSINNVVSGIGHKPILRPLSDLANENTIQFYGLGSVELELINIDEWTEELINEIKTGQKFKLSQFEYLYSKHFDIHNLIENNLAIDKNTII